jgi:signal peptidase I
VSDPKPAAEPARGAFAADATGKPLRKPFLRELLESILVALILTLFVRTWILQAFEIPTESMEPNLRVGERLLVNKVAYSASLGAFEDWLLGKREIARGDVVLFKYPQDPSRNFIKRVIGLSGEIVAVRGGHVLVNDQTLAEPYAHFRQPVPRHEDASADLALPSDAASDSFGPARVPEGELFVLGDNRDYSRDSRSWGFLPRDQVKGRALIVYWSYPDRDARYHRAGFLPWMKVIR